MSECKLVYRADIDGLRAVAVILVVVFHAFPTWTPGGFSGVDVFFVISGYLITAILLREHENEAFSLAGFYRRRVQRIFPALVVVLLLTFGFGWFVLMKSEFQNLGAHVVAGSLFASNFLQMTEDGYFVTATEFKPLVHLWSLSIEEQFYLVWPLLLGVIIKAKKKPLVTALVCAVLSFSVNLVFRGDRILDYFSPQTRAWELLAGCIVAIVLSQHRDVVNSLLSHVNERARARLFDLMAGVGLVFVLASGFLLNSERQFPGFWALFPVVGSALLIGAGALSPSSFFLRVLSNKVLVWVGLISYPLYLFHWPILVYLKLLSEGGEPSVAARIVAVGISVGASWLVYRFFEQPVRRTARRQPNTSRIALCLACAILFIVPLGIIANLNIFSLRDVDTQTSLIDAAQKDRNYKATRFEMGKIVGQHFLKGKTGSTTLFFGDSQMGQWFPRVETLYTRDELPAFSARFVSRNHCWPTPLGEDLSSPENISCRDYYEAAIELARAPEVRRVVLGGRWQFRSKAGRGEASQRLVEDLKKLKSAGKEIYLIDVTPEGPVLDPLHVARPFRLANLGLGSTPPLDSSVSMREFWRRRGKSQSAQVQWIAGQVGAVVLAPFENMCPGFRCRVLINGRAVFVDWGHFTASQVEENASFLDEVLM